MKSALLIFTILVGTAKPAADRGNVYFKPRELHENVLHGLSLIHESRYYAGFEYFRTP